MGVETHHGGANGRRGDASGSHLTFGCNDVRWPGRTLRTVAHVPRFCGVLWIYRDLLPVWGTRLLITQELRRNEPEISRSWENMRYVANHRRANRSDWTARTKKSAVPESQRGVTLDRNRLELAGRVCHSRGRRTRRGSGAPPAMVGRCTGLTRAGPGADAGASFSSRRSFSRPCGGSTARGRSAVNAHDARVPSAGEGVDGPTGGTCELRRRRRRRRRRTRASTITSTSTSTSTTTACPRCSPAVPRARFPDRAQARQARSSTAGTSTRRSRGQTASSPDGRAPAVPVVVRLQLDASHDDGPPTSSTAPGSTSTRTGSHGTDPRRRPAAAPRQLSRRRRLPGDYTDHPTETIAPYCDVGSGLSYAGTRVRAGRLRIASREGTSRGTTSARSRSWSRAPGIVDEFVRSPSEFVRR